uniref:Uncharacterized protein n=1 Tax=Anguilla anguilla TaxID=7936 RepID=A0A0E9X347_ANGAN
MEYNRQMGDTYMERCSQMSEKRMQHKTRHKGFCRLNRKPMPPAVNVTPLLS